VRDLATIADNRNQKGAPPLVVAATRPTLAVLQKHFFNGLLWPDFSLIPNKKRAAIRYQVLEHGKTNDVAGYEVCAVPVSHTIDCSGFTVRGKSGALGYSGDTGPTDALWRMLNETEDLKALLMEVSFPNAEARLARVSGHHTPETLARDLRKLERSRELPTLLYHIKPAFERAVERECARLKALNLEVCSLGDQYIL
jgi:3',5'-cyclic-nucleotide phosphodiesterase